MSAELSRARQQAPHRWWGPLPLEGGPRRIQIGPLRTRLTRGRGDLRLEWSYGTDPLDATVALDAATGDDSPAWLGAGDGQQGFSDKHRAPEVRRFALAGHHGVAQLSPALADLSVVTRPEHAFIILPGEGTTIYVGTPLLLRVDVGDVPLIELPLSPLRHTWFGSAEEGHLAYASRTYCRLSIEELPRTAHRAYTAVTLHNDADTPLELERLLIPVTNLSLGVDGTGRFWTDDLHLVRTSGEPYAPLEPAHGNWLARRSDVDLLAEPRLPLGGTGLLRLLAPIF